MNFIDAHVHVWTRDSRFYPLAAGFAAADLRPASFTPEELFAHTTPAGVARVNLVQSGCYGFDNSYLLDVLARQRGVCAGTAVLDPYATDLDRRMNELAGRGVRAFRIHPRLSRQPVEAWLRPEGYGAMFAAAAVNGQALSCLIDPSGLPEIDRMCAAYPDTAVIIDHLARIGADGEVRAADVRALGGLARHRRVLVKVGAFYALGQKTPPYDDLTPLIREVVAAFGARRCMWESDSPYQVQGRHTYRQSLDLVRRLDFLSADDRDWLLRRTAAGVFFSV